MAEHQIRRLPVVEEDKLIGIVSLGDFAISKLTDDQAKEALSEISEQNLMEYNINKRLVCYDTSHGVSVFFMYFIFLISLIFSIINYDNGDIIIINIIHMLK